MKRICLLLLVVTAVLFATNSVSAGETKVGGSIFANWRLHLNSQQDKPGHYLGKSFNSFDVTRARLILDQKFNEKYSANLMIDVVPRSSTDEYGLQYRVRSAYIQIDKALPYTSMRFGMHGILWIDALEKIWGLRFIDAVSLDKLGYYERADLGFTITGECPGNYGMAAVQIMNGGGYTHHEMNKYKDFVFYAAGYPIPKNPDFGECGAMIQYYKGWPNIENNMATVGSFSKNTKKDRLQLAAVAKYRKWVSGVVEYFHTWDDTTKANPADPATNVEKAKGFSLLGKVNVATAETWLSRVYLFAKYEWIDKHLQMDSKDFPLESQNGDARYFLGGIGYEPIDGYQLALTIVRETVKVNNQSEIVEDEKNSFMVNMQVKF